MSTDVAAFYDDNGAQVFAATDVASVSYEQTEVHEQDIAFLSKVQSPKLALAQITRRRTMAREFLELIAIFKNTCSAEGEMTAITVKTYRAACDFIRLLPDEKQVPKIRPDGEGGLTMVWEDSQPIIAVLNDRSLDVIVGAATEHAKYFTDLPMGTFSIPSELLHSLPPLR